MNEPKQELPLDEYIKARKKTIEASIASEQLAGNAFKETCERHALAEITALEMWAAKAWNTRATDKRVGELERENAKLRQHAEKLAEALYEASNCSECSACLTRIRDAITAYRTDFPKEGK